MTCLILSIYPAFNILCPSCCLLQGGDVRDKLKINLETIFENRELYLCCIKAEIVKGSDVSVSLVKKKTMIKLKRQIQGITK